MHKIGCIPDFHSIARDYFWHMSAHFPIMCMSDEFFFLPRARDSRNFLNIVDSLDQNKLSKDISYITRLREKLDTLSLSKKTGLDDLIDSAMLRQSMSSFLMQFDKIKLWRKDPTLYLKIILLSINQLTRKHAFDKYDLCACLLSRLVQIPRLLNEAKANLVMVDNIHLETAVSMLNAAILYYRNLSPLMFDRTKSFSRDFARLTKNTILSLLDFKKFLMSKTPYPIVPEDNETLKDILHHSFSYKRDLREIFDIAYEKYNLTLRELNTAAKKISGKKSWQTLISGYRLCANDTKGLLELYSKEVKRLKNMIKQKRIIPITDKQKLIVKETPPFMVPIRASASYSCPISNNPMESGFFYLTPQFEKNRKTKGRELNNIHAEYLFVSAHETFPGHHLLDDIRRHLKNNVRQQIESPMFYEGWASYSEELIVRLGYVKDPVQKLIGLKRQAWRAVRALLDVGIRINRFTVNDAETKLEELGYSRSLVRNMVRHYLLTCGYQLCYTIGKHEIEALEKMFVPRLGLRKFFDLLLKGGQLPFDLIKKRLEALVCKKNS